MLPELILQNFSQSKLFSLKKGLKEPISKNLLLEKLERSLPFGCFEMIDAANHTDTSFSTLAKIIKLPLN